MKCENMKQEVQIMPTNDTKMGIMYFVKANFVKRNYKVHNYKY